jgi:PST family polysaccharide transporter
MMYQELAAIDIGASVISTAVAIAMAVAGFAYWALVVRPLVANVLTAIGVWWKCRWVPGYPRFTPGVKEMLKFGFHWIGYTGTNFIGNFADRVALGRIAGPMDLGFYQKACLVYENSLDFMTTTIHVWPEQTASRSGGAVAVLVESSLDRRVCRDASLRNSRGYKP